MWGCASGASFSEGCHGWLFTSPKEEAEECAEEVCEYGYSIVEHSRMQWCNISDGLPARVMAELPVGSYTVHCNSRPDQSRAVGNGWSLFDYFDYFRAILQLQTGADSPARPSVK